MSKFTRVKQILNDQKLGAVLISSVPNIIYLTNYSNFSTEYHDTFLFITIDKQYIITNALYAEEIKKIVPHFIIITTSAKYNYKKAFSDLVKDNNVNKLGIEDDNLTVSEYKMLKPLVKTIINAQLSELRTIKDKLEIDLIQKACAIGDDAFNYILGKIKLGVSEKELAWELEKYIKNNLADLAFPPIIAFGTNSSVPHHQTGDQKLKSGDFILLDFGVKYNNYCSDMTRTLVFGKATARQKKIYQTILSAQQLAIKQLNNRAIEQSKTILGARIDKFVRNYIISQGYTSIPHSLGHGIGLEVHEQPRLSPNSKSELKEGMVFSIEPGIYIPSFGGVRIEDLFVIKNNQLRQLTHSPKRLIEL